jgi:hypothetical protein
MLRIVMLSGIIPSVIRLDVIIFCEVGRACHLADVIRPNTIMLSVVTLRVLAPCLKIPPSQGTLTKRGVLSTVDLLIKIGCFTKKKYIVSVRKATNLN